MAGNVGESQVEFTVDTSLIGKPGWIDDITLFAGIAAIATVLAVYLSSRCARKLMC